ncbi:putative immunity protein [Pseudonocardia sp. HH130630-07]|uniref:putative immunity protein n=1 Tax=Pseudonocardia sp. HH130630-07 TaxID=1690815 RepID=UPI000814F83E|nr:hypothetical protein [Pseudonocardia sp. HH130630-07]ANY05545.1 hypothetical protein AFB00_03640 [Pseudonocardia sp. HH130630-07]
MPDDPGITTAELRLVTRFTLGCADPLLAVFETGHPDDGRPRAALDAARLFADGAPRSRLQRVTSLDAHRAATAAAGEPARCAARAAGDAASSAYLHPPAQVAGWTSRTARETQVAHVLRPAALAARIAELASGDDRAVGDALVDATARSVAPALARIVGRYPPVRAGRDRVAQLTAALDARFRALP